MLRSPGLTRGRGRGIALVVLAGVLVITAGSLARASGAGGVTAVSTQSAAAGYPIAEADQPWAYQRFLVSGQSDMSRLNQLGVDLGESLDKNKDGTMWAYAVVTAAQREYLAKLGFRPGSIVQTSADAEKARLEMTQRMRMEHAAIRAAKLGRGRRHEATVRGERDDQDHAGRLLPEPLRHLAVGRSQVERCPGECQRAAGIPRLPGHRQQPVRHLRRLADRRLLGQARGRRLRAEHGRLPGAQRRVLHRRRGDLAQRVPDEHAAGPRRRALPVPLPAREAGPQGQRRDGAALADPRSRRVELHAGRQRTDPVGHELHRHAAAIPRRVPARLLLALPDARGRDGDDPGAARAVPRHHAADPGDLQDERLPPERNGLDGLHSSDERRQHRPAGHARRVAGRLRDAGHLHGHHGAERRGRPEHLEVR